MAEVIHLIIDRSLWHRGQGSGGSFLLNSRSGKMCCVGFHALTCGMKPAEIAGYSTVLLESKQAIKYPWTTVRFKRDYDPQGIQILYWLNDHVLHSTTNISKDFLPPITEQERERRIAEIFLRHNVKVEYIN